MLKKFAVAAALALGASSAFAAPATSGPSPTLFYGGVDLGTTKVSGLDGNKASYGAFVGYGFNRNLAVELGYRQQGKYDFLGADVTFKQTHVSVVGSVPLNEQFSFYSRLGYNNVKADVSIGGYSGSADESGVLFGIGAHYRFAQDILGRVEIQRPASDVTNVHVGVVFEF